MAYIGKIPLVGNFQICDAISVVNGQAAYTMQVASVNVIPESANHMIVSLNGVIQKPGSSYTVSGSTITFSQNLVTGDVIDFIQILGSVLDIGTPSDATVTTAKLADDSVTAAKLNNDIISGSTELASEPADTDEFLVSDAGTLKRIDYSHIKGGGITMADNWRITANLTTSSGQQFITANWERNDSSSTGIIGSAMTESSGVFTFPSTGIYLIMVGAYFVEGTAASYYAGLNITTTENNSSYIDRVQTYGHVYNSSEHISIGLNYIFDVTNTSTHKFKLEAETQAAMTLTGDTDKDRTWVRFIRLGDT